MSASVLISVYDGESAANLSAALQSLIDQTRPPDEIVLVKDGPLSPGLEATIDRFLKPGPAPFRIVALEENRGLTAALNAGLEACKGDYVLRMDADDIAMPQRFERQLDFMESRPEVAVLGTAMREFRDAQAMTRYKPVKESHEAILKQLPWRNPMNHPTVCFRAAVINEAGGYPDLPFLEDYYLWARLMAEGHRFHNLAEALHLYRFDDNTLGRRSGWVNFRNECRLRLWMYRHGLVRLPVLAGALAMQLLLRFSPTAVQRWLWRISRQPGEQRAT